MDYVILLLVNGSLAFGLFLKNKIKDGDGVWHREHMLLFFLFEI
jgi:hypothetical protein